jgi:hypothetical protein
MQHRQRDASAASNETILREILAPVPLWTIPFLGENPARLFTKKNPAKKLEKTLAAVVGGR